MGAKKNYNRYVETLWDDGDGMLWSASLELGPHCTYDEAVHYYTKEDFRHGVRGIRQIRFTPEGIEVVKETLRENARWVEHVYEEESSED